MISSMKMNRVILWGGDKTNLLLISLQIYLCPSLKKLSAKNIFLKQGKLVILL